MEEKGSFLSKAASDQFVLFFEHDAVNECCTLQHTEKGVRLHETFHFSDLF
jgi:hypothetical protein